jgi:hypothetical protein
MDDGKDGSMSKSDMEGRVALVTGTALAVDGG